MPFRDIARNEEGLVGIGIDLTEVCNRKCVTCFAAHTPREMPYEVFAQIVDQARSIGFPELYILGGEPTLHPKILDCLNYAREAFKVVILVTNMDRLANMDFCGAVAESGCIIAGQRHTMLSDGVDADMERLLTGGDHQGTSFRAWSNVEKVFPPQRVCVQCCITRPVMERGAIFDVFRWCRKMGYEPVMEFTKEGSGFKRGCALDVDPAEMMKALLEFQRIDREEFGLPGASLLSPQAYGKTCHMQENSIHFFVDGTAVPCVGFPGLSYGHISRDGLDKILHHPLRARLAQPQTWIYGYCRDECPHFDLCTGGCRGSSFDITGCYRASFHYCPHVPRDRFSLADMIPPTCSGCFLEGNPTCHPRR
ncbi:MAG: SPASM domain-containing protein [bacterium]|nr:SPASM domain-containing protein [bacterium]